MYFDNLIYLSLEYFYDKFLKFLEKLKVAKKKFLQFNVYQICFFFSSTEFF